MNVKPARLAALPAAALIALSLAGCHGGNSPHHVSATASQAAKADARKGEQIVAGCLKTNTTGSGILHCVVPKGSGLRLKACVIHAIAADNPLTKTGRHTLEYTALPTCVEKYR